MDFNISLTALAVSTVVPPRSQDARFPNCVPHDLNKYCAVLAKEFDFDKKLNSTARQSSAERAWSAISRFLERVAHGGNPQDRARPLLR